tara:strand:- start:176 stop:895 length:720 start_codon:yes stop_codon:yes gene_type:complete
MIIENNDILGGVSPIKARQSSRGGKGAGRATSTGKRRGGFAKAKGGKGKGGPNVGGYNVMTRFTPGKPWSPPVSGGTTIIPDFSKLKNEKDPNSIDKKDPRYPYKEWTPGTPGSEKIEEVLKKGVGTWDKDKEGRLPKWSEAWDLNLEDIKNKYEDFDAYVQDQKNIQAGKYKGATKEQIDKSIKEKRVTKVKGTDGYYTYYNADGGVISEDEYNRTKSPGKMKLGGYKFGEVYKKNKQ